MWKLVRLKLMRQTIQNFIENLITWVLLRFPYHEAKTYALLCFAIEKFRKRNIVGNCVKLVRGKGLHHSYCAEVRSWSQPFLLELKPPKIQQALNLLYCGNFSYLKSAFSQPSINWRNFHPLTNRKQKCNSFTNRKLNSKHQKFIEGFLIIWKVTLFSIFFCSLLATTPKIFSFLVDFKKKEKQLTPFAIDPTFLLSNISAEVTKKSLSKSFFYRKLWFQYIQSFPRL